MQLHNWQYRAVLRYPGGKSKRHVAEQIVRHAPHDIQAYREPFAGGAGVFFALPKFSKRWLNDRNSDLMAVYRALRDEPIDFVESCRRIDPPQRVPRGQGKYRDLEWHCLGYDGCTSDSRWFDGGRHV